MVFRNFFFLIFVLFIKWNCVKVNKIFLIKKRWFEIVYGLNSFFFFKIKLKILKLNNWFKIEFFFIWKF